MAVFAAGFVGGGLVVLTVQSRPAPAVPAEPRRRRPPDRTRRAHRNPSRRGAAGDRRRHLRGAGPCLAGPRHHHQDPAARHRCARTAGAVPGGADHGRGRPRRARAPCSPKARSASPRVTLDKYGGRVVADAGTRSIANVSAELLAKGHARSYGGGKRRGWCDDGGAVARPIEQKGAPSACRQRCRRTIRGSTVNYCVTTTVVP